jgi:hypothetical protein
MAKNVFYKKIKHFLNCNVILLMNGQFDYSIKFL